MNGLGSTLVDVQRLRHGWFFLRGYLNSISKLFVNFKPTDKTLVALVVGHILEILEIGVLLNQLVLLIAPSD